VNILVRVWICIGVGWFGQQGLAIVDEGFRRGNNWGHHHFLLRPGPASPAS
jgi:hypothetical protein